VPVIGPIVIAAGAVAAAAFGGARTLVERRRVRRELVDLPPLGTETPDGTSVRVTGTVRVREATIVAPLSGVECVAARARAISGVRVAGVGSREWFAIVSFVLERDGEPPVIVDGMHARLDLPLERLGRAKRDSPERARREQLLLQLGVHAFGWGAKFEEVVVTPGMRVSVAGMMMLAPSDAPPSPDRELGFREPPPATIRIVGSATYPLIIGVAVA
jgi:hypothetical protein